jgi:hypothetical protein
MAKKKLLTISKAARNVLTMMAKNESQKDILFLTFAEGSWPDSWDS